MSNKKYTITLGGRNINKEYDEFIKIKRKYHQEGHNVVVILPLENLNKKLRKLELYKEYFEIDRLYVKNNFFLELEVANRRREILKEIEELEKS